MDESGKVNNSQAGDIDDKLKAEVDLSDDKNQQQDQQRRWLYYLLAGKSSDWLSRW